MLIRDILRAKGSDVVTISPQSTVLDAVGLLMDENLGALVVTEEDDVAGIISERDVLRLMAEAPDALGGTTVSDIMTTDLVMAVPGDDVQYAMDVMTRNRVRHLPILADGLLAGIVSIGDVVNALRDGIETENRYLRDYIAGRPS